MENSTIRLDQEVEVPDSNFNNFVEALTSVFIVIANENWTTVFIEHMRAFNPYLTSIYFLSLLIIGQWLLFNLFIAHLTINFTIWSAEDEEIDREFDAQQQSGALTDLGTTYQTVTTSPGKNAKVKDIFRRIREWLSS